MAEGTERAMMSSQSDAAPGPYETQETSPSDVFRKIFNKKALDGFNQDTLFQVLPPNINESSHFHLAVVQNIRPMLHAIIG